MAFIMCVLNMVSGNLTDHYDPKDEVIRLSDSVYGSASVAAVGVAAHEAGHAVQHATGYIPIKVRSAIIPITQIGSQLSIPLILMGFCFSSSRWYLRVFCFTQRLRCFSWLHFLWNLMPAPVQ